MDTIITISIAVGIIILLAIIFIQIRFENTKSIQSSDLENQRRKWLDRYNF